VGFHSFVARPGHHLAPQPLSSGKNVFEALGEGFTLLALDGDAETVAAFQAIAAKRRLPLEIVEDSRAQGRERYEARYVLVRPDQFVAWAGEEGPDDIDALLRKVGGG
jgi:predicted lipoprotein with Yx(FWY)xxD motif